MPAGSVLIVEGPDRLSCAEPLQAKAQLAQILNPGITVVTASDGREYNRGRFKARPMDLVQPAGLSRSCWAWRCARSSNRSRETAT
ncbi:hypothetical protein BCEN4_530039 [Burkholderia cenocepacia]|nr:hypothetical protein BCEN4_530039 [Burkholderia cenocepacia]